MSFILDALKKSETQRQKQAGPALFEVKVAPPRARFPVWAVVVGILLGINLIGVVWLAMRGDSPAEKPAASAPAAAGSASGAAAGTPATTATQGAGAANGGVVPMPGSAPAGAAQGTYPAAPAAPGYPGYAPGAYPQAGNYQQGGPPGSYAQQPGYPQAPGYAQPGYPQAQGYPPQQGYAPAQSSGPAEAPPFNEADPAYEPRLSRSRVAASGAEPMNPDDEPAVAPRRSAGGSTSGASSGDAVARAAQARADGATRRGDVPTYEDMQAKGRGRMPELRLDLHVYAARPQDRFVMVNMRKLHEGESLNDGVRVEHIVTDGAVLSFHGEQFFLEKQ